jgi:uncharacterized protein (DUF3820 family)
MTQPAVTPARTRAIVVGIDSYAAGPSWRLKGPASDAVKFADWLVRRGVPPGKIALFLSPLTGAGLTIPDGVRGRSADQATVEAAFTDELRAATDPLVILYWGGHGVVEASHTHKLFYADASEANKRCLDLTRLLTFLRSDYFPAATLGRLIAVVDTCANLAESQNWHNALSSTDFPVGKPVAGREQFVLFAAKPGQTADNLDAEGTGLLSRELRPLLEEVPAGTWPPDMADLKGRIFRRFGELRAADRTEQTPAYFLTRDWGGNLETIGAATSAGAADAAAVVEIPWIDPQVKSEIVKAMLQCESLKVLQVRELTLLQLRPALYINLSRYPQNPYYDCLSILDSVLARYPGGLRELLWVMAVTDADLPAFRHLVDLLVRHLPGFTLRAP